MYIVPPTAELIDVEKKTFHSGKVAKLLRDVSCVVIGVNHAYQSFNICHGCVSEWCIHYPEGLLDNGIGDILLCANPNKGVACHLPDIVHANKFCIRAQASSKFAPGEVIGTLSRDCPAKYLHPNLGYYFRKHRKSENSTPSYFGLPTMMCRPTQANLVKIQRQPIDNAVGGRIGGG